MIGYSFTGLTLLILIHPMLPLSLTAMIDTEVNIDPFVSHSIIIFQQASWLELTGINIIYISRFQGSYGHCLETHFQTLWPQGHTMKGPWNFENSNKPLSAKQAIIKRQIKQKIRICYWKDPWVGQVREFVVGAERVSWLTRGSDN